MSPNSLAQLFFAQLAHVCNYLAQCRQSYSLWGRSYGSRRIRSSVWMHFGLVWSWNYFVPLLLLLLLQSNLWPITKLAKLSREINGECVSEHMRYCEQVCVCLGVGACVACVRVGDKEKERVSRVLLFYNQCRISLKKAFHIYARSAKCIPARRSHRWSCKSSNNWWPAGSVPQFCQFILRSVWTSNGQLDWLITIRP